MIIKSNELFHGFLLLLFLGSCGHETPVSFTKVTVQAPFDMPDIEIPDFSGCGRYSILDFGAVAGEKAEITTAIAQAITAAHEAGGGVVVVPAGEWLTGTVHLQSHVNLHLEAGATLLFSDDPKDYLPPVLTTWEGMECYNYSPLIYAYGCENIAITGKGTLKAEMGTWQEWFARPPAHMNSLKRLYTLASEGSAVEERQMVNDSSHLRPQFIQFNRCHRVLMEGISIVNSPFWVIHPYRSADVVIRDVQVTAHGHNNDGVDPEMCQNVLIENCVLDQGDDAISVKSGRNQDAWRLHTPSKNIVIRNCRVKNGHQLLAIGSELSGGVENVFLDSCIVENGSKLFHLVFIKTNERRGGYVKNIQVSHIEAGNTKLGVLGIETDVLYQWRDLVPTYERRLTPISDVSLSHIRAGAVNYMARIAGQQELPVQQVSLEDVSVGSVRDTAFQYENVRDFTIDGLPADSL